MVKKCFSLAAGSSLVQSARFSQAAAAAAAQFSQSAYVGSFICEVVGAQRAPNEGPKGLPMPSAGARRRDPKGPELLVYNIATI